jgi:hypothetical protein
MDAAHATWSQAIEEAGLTWKYRQVCLSPSLSPCLSLTVSLTVSTSPSLSPCLAMCLPHRLPRRLCITVSGGGRQLGRDGEAGRRQLPEAGRRRQGARGSWRVQGESSPSNSQANRNVFNRDSGLSPYFISPQDERTKRSAWRQVSSHCKTPPHTPTHMHAR